MPEDQSPPSISKEDAEIVKTARDMSDHIRTDAWKVVENTLKKQVEERLMVLSRPMHSLGGLPEFVALDYASKAAALESIKGAIVGLRLAMDLPHAIIRHSDQIRSKLKGAEDVSA
jgi:hypothetical protein